MQALGTNHPLSDYTGPELLALIGAASRDDLIYGLKQCAKLGHTLAPGCVSWLQLQPHGCSLNL